ncbi:hypothetical protein [Thermogymnomonas acidicola]|uniref:hypothetical protein n=1 Tax=Thermogymnomonas acidicola TaxID=399579 RepID=UPI000946688F|nr:hypothetical protein [Thermogymnomonas acidicola]
MQYLKKALYQMHAYVVLPNGTKIGNTSGTDLSSQTFDITGISPPPSTLESDQITIAIDSFKLLGLNFQAKYDTRVRCSPGQAQHQLRGSLTLGGSRITLTPPLVSSSWQYMM